MEPETDQEVVPDLSNWYMRKFTSEEIIIDLNFTYPSLVSAYYDLDLIQVKVLQNGFFASFSDYQFLEEDYVLQARPVPPLCSGDDPYCGSNVGFLIGLLVILCLLVTLILMMFFNIGMGRVWSLYFMLQLVTNFENYEKLIPAPSTKEFLQFLEEISNFKISEIKQVYHFFSYDNNKSQNWIFA